MFLYFPFMHPDLLPAELRAALPDSLQYLDPGLAKPGGPAHHLPPELPFDARTSPAPTSCARSS